MYIIGGHSGRNNFLDSVEIYNPPTKSLKNGPTLPIPIGYLSAVAVGKFIIINIEKNRYSIEQTTFLQQCSRCQRYNLYLRRGD